ncbi:MAG: hypothetical protein M3Q64_00985, partial [bacterium]|nr:hypothetical protein [bacterium]
MNYVWVLLLVFLMISCQVPEEVDNANATINPDGKTASYNPLGVIKSDWSQDGTMHTLIHVAEARNDTESGHDSGNVFDAKIGEMLKTQNLQISSDVRINIRKF